MTTCNPDTCTICKKVGLSILPLRYGTVPSLSQDGTVNKMPELPAGLGAQVKDKRLTQHDYALRVLRQGYVYLLRLDDDSSKEWFGWEVTGDGYCIPFDPMHDPVPSKPQDTFMCSSKATNVPATMISVKEPETAPLIYLMFAEHPLTKKKLGEFQAGKHDALAMRMQFFSPKAFVASKGAGPGGIHTVKIDDIDKHTIDYNQNYFPFLAYRDKVTGVNGDHALFGIRPRHYMVPELRARFEKQQGPFGIALALWDSVGITAELNHARNQMAGRAALVAGLGDEKKTRERIIADTIDGIRLNAKANPGPIWNRNFGPDRFLRHIDQGKWETACKVNQAFDKLKTTVKEISADYVKWKESDNWKWIARHEYDPADHRSGLHYEKMVAASVVGSGITQLERDEVWAKLWSLSSNHPDNWLAAGLAGLHTDFQSFFDANKNWYREYDTAKGLAAVAKELSVNHVPKLVELHGKIRNQRAANDATAAIIETLSGIMFHLSVTNKDAYHKTMLSVAKTLVVRADVLPQPVLVRGTAAAIDQAVFEIAVGKPRTAPPLRIQGDLPATRGAYLATKGNLGQRGLELSQALDGALLLDPPQGRTQIREVAAWVVTRAQTGTRQLQPKDLKALGLTTVDLTRPAANGSMRNPFLENQLKRSGAKLDAVLGAGALLFQVWTFEMMLTERNKSTDPRVKFEYAESCLTAILSAASALYETRAAYGLLTGAPVQQVASRITVAARLSAASSIIDGIYLVYKGIRNLKEKGKEDRECALWTIGSGVFLLAAGGATLKLGAVGAASVLVPSGAVAAGSVVAAGVASEAGAAAGAAVFGGPVVWTLIVVSLIGGAMYMGWQAMVTDSSYMLPVEYWMDSSAFGLRKHVAASGAENLAFYDKEKKGIQPFASLSKELEALQSIFLTATGKLDTLHSFGNVEVFYEVAAPRFIAGAVLTLDFFVQDNGKAVRVKTLTITHDDKLARTSDAEWHEKKSVVRDDGARTKLDPKTGMVITEGSFLMVKRSPGQTSIAPGRTYAGHFELVAGYLPDPNQYPGLKTTFTDKAY